MSQVHRDTNFNLTKRKNGRKILRDKTDVTKKGKKYKSPKSGIL